jgi:hypothetical protein
MGNTATKRGRPKKPKKGTAAHKAAAIRRSSKAPNKRDSAAYLLSAKNKRSPKGLSLKRVSIVGAGTNGSRTNIKQEDKPLVKRSSQAKRGSISISRKTVTVTNSTDKSTENKLVVENDNLNNNISRKEGDYEECSHDVALLILHSTPSQIRKHLEKLGAADGLNSDQGSDTESEFNTDDEAAPKDE